MQHQNSEGDEHRLRSHARPQPQPDPQSSFYHSPSSQSHYIIDREIEKEMIRQEIIMSEILRRRELEAEVRREMMVEKVLAAQQARNNVLPFGSPSQRTSDLLMRLPLAEARDEGRFLERRLMLSSIQLNNLGRESRLSESLQIEGASADVREVKSSETESIREGVKQKERINLQQDSMAKATENRAKRDLSGIGATEAERRPTKKTGKVEWICDICQVSCTCGQGLNDHLNGKKHKMKEAALVEKKATTVLITVSDDLDNLKKRELVAPDEVKKDSKQGKEKYPFWCEICELGVASKQVMYAHENGKKHRRRLDKRNASGNVRPPQKDEHMKQTGAGDAAVEKEQTPEQDAAATMSL